MRKRMEATVQQPPRSTRPVQVLPSHGVRTGGRIQGHRRPAATASSSFPPKRAAAVSEFSAQD